MKKLSTLLLVVVFILCVYPAFSAGQSEATVVDGPVELSWWHLWGGSRTELIDALMEEYKLQNPNVSFNVTFTPPNELMKKVIQAAGTGTLPDIVQIHSGWYTNLMPAETLEDLTPYAEKDGLDLKKLLVEAEMK
jgi:ABC-type glycerol-3-phosphate transport system substrate-binding protein